jgi:4-hydroxy-3-methylbut-2-enyl diphosphate reductase
VNPTEPNAPERLVVAAPLRIEARALRRGAPGVRVLRTGMGPERARHAMARLRVDPAERVIVSGFCGALEATLEPGDVIVASELRGGVRHALEVEWDLVNALEGQGLRVRVAPLVSVARVARGEKRRALCSGGAHAVDMESVWLAPAAAGRPFAVVRVVLDGPHHELLRPAFARNLLRAARSLRGVARALDLWARATSSHPAVRPARPAAIGEA